MKSAEELDTGLRQPRSYHFVLALLHLIYGCVNFLVYFHILFFSTL